MPTSSSVSRLQWRHWCDKWVQCRLRVIYPSAKAILTRLTMCVFSEAKNLGHFYEAPGIGLMIHDCCDRQLSWAAAADMHDCCSASVHPLLYVDKMLLVQKRGRHVKVLSDGCSGPCWVTCYRWRVVRVLCPSQQGHMQVRLAVLCPGRGRDQPASHSPRPLTEFACPGCHQSWWLCLTSVPHSPIIPHETCINWLTVHLYIYVSIDKWKLRCIFMTEKNNHKMLS